MKMLITAANSAQAYQLKTILGTDAPVLLGDYLDIPEVLIKSGKMIKTPDPAGPSFVHEMLTLCLDNDITELYALRRPELLLLAEARQLFAEFDITLYIPFIETINNTMPRNITAGKIVVVKNGEVIKPLTTGENWSGASMAGNGVFKVNLEDYIIFTAD